MFRRAHLTWGKPSSRLFVTRPLGERGERKAASYLRKKGYTIVECGFANRYGEIDLVAVERRTIVFVEVKTRRRADPREALEAVTLSKQAKLSRIGLSYLKRHDLLECSARFDVMGIVWPKGQRRPEITHIKSAFEPCSTTSFFF